MSEQQAALAALLAAMQSEKKDSEAPATKSETKYWGNIYSPLFSEDGETLEALDGNGIQIGSQKDGKWFCSQLLPVAQLAEKQYSEQLAKNGKIETYIEFPVTLRITVAGLNNKKAKAALSESDIEARLAALK